MNTVLVQTMPDNDLVKFTLQLNTTVQINAQSARKWVNQHVVPELGTGLIARIPELLIRDGKSIIWRVPIHLSLPTLGDLGQVGVVELDATAVQLLTSPAELEGIRQHAQRLYIGATS